MQMGLSFMARSAHTLLAVFDKWQALHGSHANRTFDQTKGNWRRIPTAGWMTAYVL